MGDKEIGSQSCVGGDDDDFVRLDGTVAVGTKMLPVLELVLVLVLLLL